MTSRSWVRSVEEAQGGGRMGGVALGEGGQIEGALAQQGADEGGAQQCEVAGAAGMAAKFGVFVPNHVAAVVIGAGSMRRARARRQSSGSRCWWRRSSCG